MIKVNLKILKLHSSILASKQVWEINIHQSIIQFTNAQCICK